MDKPIDNVCCVVLAAGFSRRFKSDKLLHAMPSGQTLVLETVSRYSRIFERVLVVVRQDHEPLRQLLQRQPNVEIVINKNAEKGLSQSVVESVRYSLSTDQAGDGWLFALADMPYVQTETLEKILATVASESLVQPFYQSRAGNPVFIGNAFADELLALSGDQGGKPILQKYVGNLVKVDCNDPGVLVDIDRPSDIL